MRLTPEQQWVYEEVVQERTADLWKFVARVFSQAQTLSDDLKKDFERAKTTTRGGEDATTRDLLVAIYYVVGKSAGYDTVGKILSGLLWYGPDFQPKGSVRLSKRERLLRLATKHPALRKHLIPLLRKG